MRFKDYWIYIILMLASYSIAANTQPLVSLNFQQVPIVEVMQTLSQLANKRLIVSNTVAETVTIRLDKLPWRQAFEVVINTAQLSYYQIDDNTFFIAKAADLIEHHKQQKEIENLKLKSQSIVTKHIAVSYAKATEMAAMLFFNYIPKSDKPSADTNNQSSSNNNKSAYSLLSKRGKVMVDERTNTIIVHDIAQNITKIEQIIEQLDVPLKQVMINANIVITKSSLSEDLGISWHSTDNNNGYSLGIIQNTASSTSTAQNLFLDYNSYNSSSNNILNLSLFALEKEGKVKVVAQPRITTATGQESVISSGTEVPYIVTTEDTINTLFKKALLSLKVKPNITGKDSITMDIAITQDAVGTIYSGIPSIDTNSINTHISTKDGQTLVLGGLFTNSESTTVTKLPLLGDLPWIGWLFRSTSKKLEKVELLIFITPHII